jgi:hypothetical protein
MFAEDKRAAPSSGAALLGIGFEMDIAGQYTH